MNLKTGDLLFFEGNSINSKLINFFTQSNISHVGLVWLCQISDQLYIFESGDVDDESLPLITKKNCPLNGTHLIPLEIKFKKGNKKIFVKRLQCKKSLNLDKIDKFIVKNLGKFYTSNLVGFWTQRCNPTFVNLSFMEDRDDDVLENDQHNEIMCSQLILLCFQKMGIIKYISNQSSSISPGDLYSKEIPTNIGYSFSEPELLWSE